jgi:GDP-4-dehydro-6-deoxy-D-mannose reductase
MERLLGEARPEWVFHLAGYANPRKSIQEPEQCRRDNVEGTRKLFEAIRRCGLRPRILFTSTGLVYGDPEVSGRPLDEQAALKPATPYAESKVAAEEVCAEYGRQSGFDVVRVRLFNQIGPRQSTDYFSARFAKQIVEAERGRRALIETGDLTAFRDLTDVRDMVRAFRLLMDRGESGEVYNAGRGQTWQIGEVLQTMLRLSGVWAEVKSTVRPRSSGPRRAGGRGTSSTKPCWTF